MRFVKAHAAGNDFVLLPDLDDLLTLDADLAVRLCDRRHGLGGDGAIRIAPPTTSDAVATMDYRNADGSSAEMCGNGVRCVAAVMADRGVQRTGGGMVVDTPSGPRSVVLDGAGAERLATVDMGPVDVADPEPIPGGDDGTAGASMRRCSAGNPHAVVRLGDAAQVDAVDLDGLAARVRDAGGFAGGVNVEVCAPVRTGAVRARIHERGVGETPSSGSGVAAVAAAAAAWRMADRAGRVAVQVPGGELVAEVGATVVVSGPVVVVAGGEVDRAWLTAVADGELRGPGARIAARAGVQGPRR